MTNGSMWLVLISTNRGSFANEEVEYVTVTRVMLSVGSGESMYTRSVTRIHGWMPLGDERSQMGLPLSSTRTCAPATGVRPFGQSASTSRQFRTVKLPAAMTANLVNGVFTAKPSV